MKAFIYILLVFIGFSCKTSSYADFKTKSLKSKGRTIDMVYVQKYSLSSLVKTNTVNTTPLAKDSLGDFIEPEVYFLENDYFEDLIAQKYSEYELNKISKDIFTVFKDSIEKIHPKKITFKKINILSDTTVKFRKKVIENENNVYSSYEYYTLADIIQSNYYYVISWYSSERSKYYIFDASHLDYQNIDHWLEFKINNEREIIYWKEMNMKLFIKAKEQPF